MPEITVTGADNIYREVMAQLRANAPNAPRVNLRITATDVANEPPTYDTLSTLPMNKRTPRVPSRGNVYSIMGTYNGVDVFSAPAPVGPTATFNMTQLAAANRVYQRDTRTGGGQGKGQGIIPITLSSAVAGTLSARIRSSDGVTILQAEFDAGSISNGQTTLNLSGVDARLGWFYVDLRDAVGWKNGTTLVGMGALSLWWGQSGVVDMLNKVHDTATIASTGISLPTNGTVLASFNDTFTGVASAWQFVTDVAQANTVINSAGVCEYLNRMITLTGVNCGVIGNAVGATSITTWLPGQANYIELMRVFGLAGNKAEIEYFAQGATDSFNNMQATTYKGHLATMFAGVHGVNGFAGRSVLIDSIRNIVASTFGLATPIGVIQLASYDWALSQAYTPLVYRDGEMAADGAHYLQTGNLRTARHMYRMLRPVFGAANDDKGSEITTVTRSGVNISIGYNRASGASSMAATGSMGTRFKVYEYGTRNAIALDGTTPFAINDTTRVITIKLASDPGNVKLQVVPFGPLDPVNDGHASALYDNLVNGDGITEGRNFYPPPIMFRTATSRDLTMTGAAYGSGNGKFGDTLTAGDGVTPFQRNLPGFVTGLTMEGWVRLNATDGSGVRAFFGEDKLAWFGCQNNELWAGYGAASGQVGSGLLPSNQWIHLAMVVDPYCSVATIYVNGVSVATPATTGWPNAGPPAAFSVRCFGSSGTAALVAGQLVDEIAVFEGQRYTGGFSVPTNPYAGNETGLIMLYHLDGNGLNSATLA